MKALLFAVISNISAFGVTVFNSNSIVSLGAMTNQWGAVSYGGTIGSSTDWHWIGDNHIGGWLRRTDAISATGRMTITNQFGAADFLAIGHFEADVCGAADRDFVGMYLQRGYGDLPNTVRCSPSIHVENPVNWLGPAVCLKMGRTYSFSYSWNPTNGVAGHGSLHCVWVQEDTGSQLVSDLEPPTNTGFAVDAFGISSGYLPAASVSANSVDVWVAPASYTTLPKPPSLPPFMRLFVLLGQSNARGGYPTNAQVSCSSFAASNTFIFCQGEWTMLRPSYPINNTFGPEVSFAVTLADRLRMPVGIIKRAIGSRSLDAEFVPRAGASYPIIIANTKASMALLDCPILSGVLGVEGETDSGDVGSAGRYFGNLNELMGALRGDLQYPRLPMIISRVQSWLSGAAYISQVRAAQETWSNGACINTDDLPAADGKHFNAQGLITLGQRFAYAYICYATANPEFRQFNGRMYLLTVPGADYAIERSADLQSWMPYLPPVVEMLNSDDASFFRARVR